jgi:micrococcal nuclease
MSKKIIKNLLVLAGLAAAFLISGLGNSQVDFAQKKSGGPLVQTYKYDDILVVKAIDGDTLKLEDGKRVRLIGIDTPETYESAKLYRDSQRSGQDIKTIKALGKKATDFTRDLVEGKRVRLEFDLEKRDKYNRLLAYVYLKDGTFVNAEIIRQGYASLMTYPPNVMYADTFKQLYQQARENKRGLWKE